MEYLTTINKTNKEKSIEENLNFLSENILKNIDDIKNDLINEEINNDSTTLENLESKGSEQNFTNNNIKLKGKNKKNLNSSMDNSIKNFKLNDNEENLCDNIDSSFYETYKRFEKNSIEQKIKIEKLQRRKENFMKEYFFIPRINNKKNESFIINKLNFNDRIKLYETLKSEKNKILKSEIEKKREEQYKTTFENYQNKKVVPLKNLQNSIQRLYKDDVKKRKEKQKNLNKIYEPTFKPKINKNLNRSMELISNKDNNKYDEEVLNYMINKNNKVIENKLRNKILKNKKILPKSNKK